MPCPARSFLAVAVVMAAMCGTPPVAADDIAVEKFDGGVHVTLDGKPFTDYLIHNGPKPILWPIIGPGGHR